MKDFTHFKIEIKPFNKYWRIEISEDASLDKQLDNFIQHISDRGLYRNETYITKEYQLVARITDSDKLITIHTLFEWAD